MRRSADTERRARQKMLRRDMAYPRNGKDFHVSRMQYAGGQNIKLAQEMKDQCTLSVNPVSQLIDKLLCTYIFSYFILVYILSK